MGIHHPEVHPEARHLRRYTLRLDIYRGTPREVYLPSTPREVYPPSTPWYTHLYTPGYTMYTPVPHLACQRTQCPDRVAATRLWAQF